MRRLAASLVLVVAACGSEAVPPPAATPRATRTPAPTETATPSPTATGTTPTASPRVPPAAGCRNATDPSCGAFRFEPDVDDRTIDVEVEHSPTSPRVGEEVTFTVRATDPDSPIVAAGSYRLSDDGPGEVVDDPTADCPRAYGPWEPPTAERGSIERTYRHTYTDAGEVEAFFTFFSRSYAADDHPWPDHPPGGADGRCIDPLASSGIARVDLVIRP